jgi:hypothetical protein
VFENRYLHGYEDICDPGISWSFALQAINKTSIQVVFSSIECNVRYISDISWKEYTKHVSVEEYEALFIFPEAEAEIETTYESYSDIYFIDMKDFSIDLQDCMINIIRSKDPIIKQKDDESLWEWWIEVVDIFDI